uniref:3-deoxy-D-manno-octulosonic acid transferase n=1 Tax=Desulfobacca acetoxidans TaxID=60893 RepID=A0A7C3Z327_9BACT
MNIFIYKAISALTALLGWPLFYYHLRSRRQGESFLPRLGLKSPPAPLPGWPRIWVHGVSVGEILAAAPLLAELKALLPRGSFIVSTGTETGQAVARRHLAPLGVAVCYFPLDLPWAVNRYLRVLQPDVFVALESEIWPGFLSTARYQGVSLALMNARLSDRSCRRYYRYKSHLFDIINLFEIIAAGSLEDYRRFAGLGLPGHKLFCTGNLTVDALLARRAGALPGSPPTLPGTDFGLRPNFSQDRNLIKEILALQGEPIFLAASTHPGEEELVLEAYEALRGCHPTLLLILAPRHPERAAAMGQIISRRGLGYQFWQSLKTGSEIRRQPVILVDTVGDLFHLYGAADVAFVGGSLVPHGGQNILEPAVWGLAPLFGPYLDNFRWAEEILRQAGVGTVVQDPPSLAAAARHLLENPAERRRRGEAALAALAAHQGAARRQAELVRKLVKK